MRRPAHNGNVPRSRRRISLKCRIIQLSVTIIPRNGLDAVEKVLIGIERGVDPRGGKGLLKREAEESRIETHHLQL